MKTTPIINALEISHGIALTPLRKKILAILPAAQKPLGAYDILRELRLTKPNAEPPTVYRVLEYFIKQHVLHRIESNNTYYFCQHKNHAEDHLSQLLICSVCGACSEIVNQAITKALYALQVQHRFTIQTTPVEIYGLCQHCKK